jgi:hypothetical protein
MTTALEGGEGSASRPGRSLSPWKTWYPLYRRLGGPQGRSGQVRKILHPPGFDPRTVQPVANRYTDWATRAGRSRTYEISWLCVCNLVLVIQHAKRMSRIMSSSVACPALPYFYTLSHKRHDFRGKKLPNIKSVFWFSLQMWSETFLILRRTELDIAINVATSSSSHYSCQIWFKLEFSRKVF